MTANAIHVLLPGLRLQLFPVAQSADSWMFTAVPLDLWYSVNGVLRAADQLSALWFDLRPYFS